MRINYSYLRPKKAELLRERYNIYFKELPPLNLLPVTSRTICQEGKEGITEDRDESAIYMGEINFHWGHFLIECLTRFWWIAKESADKYVFSYPKDAIPPMPANIKEAFELLGVADRIEIVNSPTRYRELRIAPPAVSAREFMYASSNIPFEIIRQNALRRRPSGYNSSPRVLMSRSKLSKATLNEIGLNEVESIFTSNGYEAVYPEALTLSELIWILDSAESTVAVCGTLPHNMMFAPSGSRLIVLEKYANINNFQQGIDVVKDLNATYIFADYLLHCIDPGLGPFIMGETPELMAFISDAGWKKPKVSHRFTRSDIARYFSLCFRHYGREWILPEWIECEIGLLREAYEKSMPIFGKWLSNKTPVLFSDWLSPRLITKWILSHLRKH